MNTIHEIYYSFFRKPMTKPHLAACQKISLFFFSIMECQNFLFSLLLLFMQTFQKVLKEIFHSHNGLCLFHSNLFIHSLIKKKISLMSLFWFSIFHFCVFTLFISIPLQRIYVFTDDGEDGEKKEAWETHE